MKNWFFLSAFLNAFFISFLSGKSRLIARVFVYNDQFLPCSFPLLTFFFTFPDLCSLVRINLIASIASISLLKPKTLIAQSDKVRVTGRDIRTLVGDTWLNDNIIDSYWLRLWSVFLLAMASKISQQNYDFDFGGEDVPLKRKQIIFNIGIGELRY